MAKPVSELTCKKCRGLIEVYKDDLGGQGVCPVCGTPVQFPAAKEPQNLIVKCIHCQTAINLPPGFKDEDIVCPSCRKFTPVTDAISRDHGTGVILKALGLKSSYWVLLLKACIYPLASSVSLLVFLLGISAVVVAASVLSKFGIAYVMDNIGDQQKQWIVVGITVFLAALIVMAAFSYYCSLLVGLVRNTVWAGRRSPPLERMDHRDNFYSVLTWAAFYFGAAFLLAYLSSGSEEIFLWTGPSVFILALLGSFAPMAFLRSEAITKTAGFNLLHVVKNTLLVPGEYFGLLVVTIITGAIYFKIGGELYTRSVSYLTGYNPNYYLGIPLQVLAITAYISSMVVGARALGIFYEYHVEQLDFQGGRLPSEKINLLLGILTLAALALFGHGLYMQTKDYLRELDRPNLAMAHMMRIHRLTRDFYPTLPQSEAELFEKLDLKALQSQTLPHPEERYGIFPLKKSSPSGLLWIYEKEPAEMGSNKVHVIRYGGEKGEGVEPIRLITVNQRDKILKLQKEYFALTDNNESAALLKKIAAAWPQFPKSTAEETAQPESPSTEASQGGSSGSER
ncbi:MAG: hypothetical protein JXA52_02025 [Planctomycetes bacterium]|nr:hypothetical protein [Planctomycetota bacterium]